MVISMAPPTPTSKLPTVTQADVQRFMRRVKVTNNCWLMQGAKNQDGYVQFQYQKTRIMSHRFSYIVFESDIPDGLEIDHLCRVKNCVNPDHLEPVTTRENLMRDPNNLATINASKMKCRRDHDLSEARLMPDGERRCLHCVKINNRLDYERNRAKVLIRSRERKQQLRREKKAIEAAGGEWGGPSF